MSENNQHYRGLAQALIALMGDLERARKNGKKASEHADEIGGPLQKKTAALIAKFGKLAEECLKLEQETREI